MVCSRGLAVALSAAACIAIAAERPVTVGDPVVVTATRFEQKREEFPIGVTVITQDQIVQSTAATLPELLAQHAGIHVRDNSGSPNWQVDMRGFGVTGDQNTLVLLDGQRLSEIDLSTVKWSSIPLSAIERIEILRGSGAVLYGGGATGGTINIITKTPRAKEKSATALAGYGNYRTSDLRAGMTVAGESLGLTLHANQYDTENYRVNNALTQRNAEGELRFSGRRATLALKFGADHQTLRLPGVRTAAQLVADRRGASTPLDFSELEGAHAGLFASAELGFGELKADLRYRKKRSMALNAPGTSDINADVISFAPRIKIPHRFLGRGNTLIVGLDWDSWDHDSVTVFPGFNSTAFARQKNQALYAQNSVLVLPGTRVTLGVRAHRTENTITEVIPAPASTKSQTRSLNAYELALRHNFTPALALYGKAGQSFRVATVDENRAVTTFLEPQTSHDAEAGVEYQGRYARFRASPYQHKLKNEIHFLPGTVVPPFGANINLPPTRRRGVEIEAGLSASENVEFFANYTHAEAKFLSGAFGGADVTGKTVPLVPKHSLGLGGAWKITGRTRVSGVMKYVGRQRFDNDQSNTFFQNMPAYTTADLKFTHETGGWLFSGGIKNLLNEKYFSYGIRNAAGTSFNAYPAQERSMFVSAQYGFR
jgi:iron complex outermembrane receptor protein